MDSVVLINPAYPGQRKPWFGMVDDPVNPAVCPAAIRSVAWMATVVTFIAMTALGAAVGDNAQPLPQGLAWPLTLAMFAGLFAPWWTRKWTVEEQKKARLRITAQGLHSRKAVGLISQAQTDAVRFGQMAAGQAALVETGRRTTMSLAWLLWHAGQRAIRILALEAELSSAGTRATGPAKAAWLADRQRQIADLTAPISDAAGQVRALADLAEDTAWAARLATEKGVLGELRAPNGVEVLTTGDISEAMEALKVWHSTWVELDGRLRAMTEQHRANE